MLLPWSDPPIFKVISDSSHTHKQISQLCFQITSGIRPPRTPSTASTIIIHLGYLSALTVIGTFHLHSYSPFCTRQPEGSRSILRQIISLLCSQTSCGFSLIPSRNPRPLHVPATSLTPAPPHHSPCCSLCSSGLAFSLLLTHAKNTPASGPLH